MEPKYSYGKKVYIKLGFYRGYTATINSFKEIKIKIQETNEEVTFIQYGVKILNVPLKEEYLIREDRLIPYKKYVIF